MAQIPGTNIASRIAPFDTADTFATHDAQWGRDGYRSVADLTERDAISDARRKEGMLVNVVATDTIYQLFGGITNANWRVYSTGAGLSTVYGTATCDTSSYVYFVSHPRVGPNSNINLTLNIPNTQAVLYRCAVSNVTSGSFAIVLDDVPDVSGYKVNWTIQNPT